MNKEKTSKRFEEVRNCPLSRGAAQLVGASDEGHGVAGFAHARWKIYNLRLWDGMAPAHTKKCRWGGAHELGKQTGRSKSFFLQPCSLLHVPPPGITYMGVAGRAECGLQGGPE